MIYKLINKDTLLQVVRRMCENPIYSDFRGLLALMEIVVDVVDPLVITTDQDGATLEFSENGDLNYKWRITAELMDD